MPGTLPSLLGISRSDTPIRPLVAEPGALGAAQKAEQAAARNVLLGCLARLLRAFGGEDTGRGSAATVPGLVDQLTARELEVLALLVAGTPTRASPGSWWSPSTRSRSR